MSQPLTYKFRLLPSRRQHAALRSILDEQRQLYNAALEERIDAYRKFGKSISLYDQFASLAELRKSPEFAGVPSNVQRGTLKRLDLAFKGFFRRIKQGEKPGFPRFKGRHWFTSFDFAEASGLRFDGKRLRFKGMPSGLRVHLHRPMPSGKILAAKFKRDAKGWCVCLIVKVETAEKRTVRNAVGLDMGIKMLAATSDGLLIPNPKAARKAAAELRRRQRHMARCKRGSNGRRKARASVARLHQKIGDTRRTALHQASALVVKSCDLIAVEDLNVKGMARGMLSKDVHDAGWSTFLDMVTYKAERAGCHLIKVDPKFTSQTCPACGAVERKTLKHRTHRCACGCIADRDVAAARVILAKAVAGLEWLNGRVAARAAGNLSSVN